MKVKKNKYNLPKGWSLAKVQRIIAYYENQTDEEAAVEDDAIFARPSETVMQIPAKLLPAVRRLIAGPRGSRSAPSKGARTKCESEKAGPPRALSA